MPLVVNLQRNVHIRGLDLRPFAERLTTMVREAEGCDFSVALVSDRRMKELNSLFRGKEATTDVLSFPAEPDEFETLAAGPSSDGVPLGDIVISAEQAAKQATENGLSLEAEI